MVSQLSSSLNSIALQQQALAATDQHNYTQAIQLYEQLTALAPDHIQNYWHLGLVQLLSGYETEGQLTWMMAMSEAEPEQAELWTDQLVSILNTEADKQALGEEVQIAWLIRQHIREIAPNHLVNLLQIVQISVQLGLFKPEDLVEFQIIELLKSEASHGLEQGIWLKVFEQVLEFEFGKTSVMEFAEACLQHVDEPDALIDYLLPKAIKFWRENIVGYNLLATYYLEVCLRYDSHRAEVLDYLSACYFSGNRHAEAIEMARRYLDLCQTLPAILGGNGTLISRLLRTGSQWNEATERFEQQINMLKRWVKEHDPQSEPPINHGILCTSFFASFYFKDSPLECRTLQNQVAQLIQDGLQNNAKEFVSKFQKRHAAIARVPNRRLKVAYISRCFRQHSVGWLSRWLFEHHDCDRFEIFTYHIYQNFLSPFTERWFIKNADHSAKFDGDIVGIAEHISETDNIDILIDLDSLTSDHVCGVMALKPAPIQVTWLGLDASGLPAIDYFMADPYVLPEDAQSYYAEKIWRLPHSYIAVDGFEVSTPTLRRDHLSIPSDAVVYLSAQQGQKRHPDNIRLQLQIIREVPGSYLLIKGYSDEALLKEKFEQMAELEGVAGDRLRFLPLAPDEPTHRANLQIADIVLDTFPYNGATTTLETLWMGIPLVTKVGQQFAARNSYGMMMNVGVTEGIAWTDDEYLEWGVRLGKDVALRQQVAWKLRQSRHSSPLWNAKQFAREMENAYEKMWQLYLDRAK